jgi:hypothetical protein
MGPVPVYDTFLEKDLQALLDRVGRGRGRGGGCSGHLKDINIKTKEANREILSCLL